MTTQAMDGFWSRLDGLIAANTQVIDRPKGTAHPRYPAMIYPLDYGYLAGTSGGDGNEIDVWRGSLATDELVAVVCTVDSLKGDAEVKLLLGCTAGEIEMIRHFYDDGAYMSCIVIHRGAE